MGLHRTDILEKHFSSNENCQTALRIFWSVFTLDRRSSLGLGVPFVIQDSFLDPVLSSMEFDHPYLRAMISFSKLSGRAWQMSNTFGKNDKDALREEIDYLDYQVVQWQKQIPASLRYYVSVPRAPETGDTSSKALQNSYLGVILSVRTNQLRNIIYRPVLQSASRMKQSPDHTLIAVDTAKDSVKTLLEIDGTTMLLHNHATFFKHFIVSSLGNLLLIAVHAPITHWPEIKQAFHSALSLLKKLSTRSRSVFRTWERLRGLEDLHAKVLVNRETTDGAQHIQNNLSGQCLIDLESSNVGSRTGGDETLLFEPQIRDEFWGVFDSPFAFGDFFNLPTLEGVNDS